MPMRKETKKSCFTVEGETEKWYLDWLQNEINRQDDFPYRATISAKVLQHPLKYAKSQNSFSMPVIAHLCDVESQSEVHRKKFYDIIDQVDKANNLGRNIQYKLYYSNYTFELWMILHKIDCNGPLADRSQYLRYINRAFSENFEDLPHYKREDNFKHCLSKLTIADVYSAVVRARRIMELNAEDPGKKLTTRKKFSYCEDNPALTIDMILLK